VRSPSEHSLRVCLLLGLAAIWAAPSAAGPFSAISVSEGLTAVNSKQFNGYVRARLPDGSYQPETFAFGDGGLLPVPAIAGLVFSDPTIDGLNLPGIARMLAGPLASQNYVRALDPEATRLLIVVYWGRTIGTTRIMDGPTKDRINFFNASLMGFDSEAHLLGESSGDTILGQLVRNVHAGTMSAVEMDRYYVILRAFDFQFAWRQRRARLLWETRFSLSERRHDFERDLPSMAQSASLYFGQDSYGMVRMPPVPEGHVHIGEIKAIDEADEEPDGSASGIAGNWQGITPGFPPVIVRVDQAGNSTFENPGQHAVLPARVSVRGDAVTVTVPGWDVLIRGTVHRDRITGTISEYGGMGSLILTRTSKPAGGSGAAKGEAPLD